MTSSIVQQSSSPSPDEPTGGDDGLQVQFDVVKLDYERTATLLDSVTRTRTSMRAASITAYLAFLGLAVQETSWALAASAALAASVFGGFDAYHGWLYHAALRRANRLERLFQHRLRALDRPYDRYPAQRLHAELEKYDFGALGQLPRFRFRALSDTVTVVALLIYGVPTIAAVICAIVVG